MVKYFVIYWKSSNKEVISKPFFAINDETCYIEAKEFADLMKRNRYDVVIVKDNNITNGESSLYEIKKYGFYKVYKVINNALIFIFLFGIIFYYLYNKFH